MSFSRDDLEELLNSVLDARQRNQPHTRMDPQEHIDHHAWVKKAIEAESERAKFYSELTKIILTWSVPFILGGAIYFLQHGTWPKT